MSREYVIERRTRAIYVQFLVELPDNPQWIKTMFQANPHLMDKLIEALLEPNPHAPFAELKKGIHEIAKEQSAALAEQQVDDPPFTLAWVQETLEAQ
jgi:hypothetical protein